MAHGLNLNYKLMYYAVRWLMHHAARQGQKSPWDLSFAENVNLFRRAQPQSGASPAQRVRENGNSGSRNYCKARARSNVHKVASARIQAWLSKEVQPLPVISAC